MRLRPRWILLLLLILAVPYAVVYVRSKQNIATLPEGIPEQLRENSDKRRVSVVNRKQWIAFDIPHGTSNLRLLSNGSIRTASLEAATSTEDQIEWSYALDYVFEDRDGLKIDAGEYHFKTRLDVYRDLDSGQSFVARYYAESPTHPAGTREMNVAISSMQTPPGRLKIRLQSEDPEIADVTVRVLCQLARPASHRSFFWNRLSNKRRKQLAAGSVHSYLLLDDREKANLLRTVWRPIAPIGYETVDYHRRTLFALRDIQEYRVLEEPIIEGWRIAPTRRGIIDVPEGSGQLQLQFTRLDKPYAIEPQLRMNWYGRRVQARWSKIISLDTEDLVSTTSIEGGLLELDPDIPLIVQAIWTPDTPPHDTPSIEPTEIDITPETAYLRTYIATVDQPVDYRMVHIDNLPTTVRVSLRRVCSHESISNVSQSIDVRWEYLDSTNKALQSGTIVADGPVSIFDRIAEEGIESRPSDPTDYYFAVPPGVAKLRLRGIQSSVLVGAYTRPPNLPKTTSIPEDYANYQAEPSKHRVWFPIRPIDYRHRTEEDRTVLLDVQSRPPETDEELAAGRYAWEAFYPQGRWKAFYALLPRESDVPQRAEAIGSTYVELAANREHPLRSIPEPGHRTVTSTLIYHFSETPRRLQILLDGQQQTEHIPQGRVGQLTIPTITDLSTLHALTVRSDATVRLWINRIEPADAETWGRQLAVRFDGQSLEFTYPKVSPDREDLVLKVFREATATSRLRLKVSIDRGDAIMSSSPSSEHTLDQRLFDIAPGDPPHGLLLDSSTERRLDSGRACILPFGSDLLPGEYTIRVQRTEPLDPAENDPYLIVYRTTPGLHEQRKISIETVTERGTP